jgi:hypothetical protein
MAAALFLDSAKNLSQIALANLRGVAFPPKSGFYTICLLYNFSPEIAITRK